MQSILVVSVPSGYLPSSFYSNRVSSLTIGKFYTTSSTEFGLEVFVKIVNSSSSGFGLTGRLLPMVDVADIFSCRLELPWEELFLDIALVRKILNSGPMMGKQAHMRPMDASTMVHM